MATTTPLHDVAKAIYEARDKYDRVDGDAPLQPFGENYCYVRCYTAMARAALEALREPSPEMVRAGANRLDAYSEGPFTDAISTWRAMIGSILEDGKCPPVPRCSTAM